MSFLTAMLLSAAWSLAPASAHGQEGALIEALGQARGLVSAAKPAVRPPPIPVQERIANGSLMTILALHPDAQAVQAELLSSGDERAFFKNRLAGSFPGRNAEQAGLLRELRRYLPDLDPATVFFVPEGHLFHSSEQYGYTIFLRDRRGRETPTMFVMDADQPGWQTASTVIHEHMHQKQVPPIEMVRRLEGATGIPRRFLWEAARRLQEGNAQLLTTNWLGVILADKDSAFGRRLRDWLREAARREGLPGAEDDSTNGHLVAWLEELAVSRHAYFQEVSAVRDFPAVKSSGAPDVTVSMSGDLRPLVEAWSTSKRRGLAILAEHARAHPDYPSHWAKKLMAGIAEVVIPAEPIGEGYAAVLVARLEAELAADQAQPGRSHYNTRPGGPDR